jgi:hypothetical protein
MSYKVPLLAFRDLIYSTFSASNCAKIYEIGNYKQKPNNLLIIIGGYSAFI